MLSMALECQTFLLLAGITEQSPPSPDPGQCPGPCWLGSGTGPCPGRKAGLLSPRVWRSSPEGLGLCACSYLQAPILGMVCPAAGRTHPHWGTEHSASFKSPQPPALPLQVLLKAGTVACLPERHFIFTARSEAEFWGHQDIEAVLGHPGARSPWVWTLSPRPYHHLCFQGRLAWQEPQGSRWNKLECRLERRQPVACWRKLHP